MSSFTAREMEIMGKAWQCMNETPNVDYDKLASLTGMTNPRSATNAWAAIKKKLAANSDATPFTAREMEIMGFAWQCMDAAPVPDYKKLAALVCMTNPRSATNAWAAIKKKIIAGGEGAENGAGPATPKGKGKKSAAAGTKRKAATQTSKATTDNDENDIVKAEENEDEDITEPASAAKPKPKRARTTNNSSQHIIPFTAINNNTTPPPATAKSPSKPKAARVRKPTKADIARAAAAAAPAVKAVKEEEPNDNDANDDDAEPANTTSNQNPDERTNDAPTTDDAPTHDMQEAKAPREGPTPALGTLESAELRYGLPVIGVPLRPLDQLSEKELRYRDAPTPGAESLGDEDDYGVAV